MYATARLPAIASNPTLNEMFMAVSGQDMPVLPIAIGVIGLLSVEVGTWSPRGLKAMQSTNPKEAEAAAKGSKDTSPKENTLEVQPSRIAVSFFRLLSVGRAVICVALPAVSLQVIIPLLDAYTPCPLARQHPLVYFNIHRTDRGLDFQLY
jgi:hypothetical protein